MVNKWLADVEVEEIRKNSIEKDRQTDANYKGSIYVYETMTNNKITKINMPDVTMNKRKLAIKLEKNKIIKKVINLATHSQRRLKLSTEVT